VRAQTVCGESWQDSSGRVAENASLAELLGVPIHAWPLAAVAQARVPVLLEFARRVGKA